MKICKAWNNGKLTPLLVKAIQEQQTQIEALQSEINLLKRRIIMAIGYTWNVSTVDTYPTLDGNADVVYNVHWRLTAERMMLINDADGNNLYSF